jgi:hypothetical protein
MAAASVSGRGDAPMGHEFDAKAGYPMSMGAAS